MRRYYVFDTKLKGQQAHVFRTKYRRLALLSCRLVRRWNCYAREVDDEF